MRQGLQFFVSVVLARLLSPEEFGTIALLALFIGIAGVFVDSGMSQALIQRQSVSDDDSSTVFWFNIVIAILVAGLLLAASPAIAVFFGKPELVPLTAIMAANIVISALGAVHQTLFTKRLAFKPLVTIGAVASVVSGACAIALAAGGWGVWALAAQTLVAGTSTTVMLWALSPWRPRFVFSFASARRLFAFGGYMLASGLLNILYERAYTLLIGKFYGAADLGHFARAEGTAALPTVLFTNTISRVAFPALSSMSHDIERTRASLRLGLQATMLINAPAMLGLAAVAEPFIATVYGPQWLPAAPLLQILCLGGVLMPMHVLNLQVLMALGRSDLFFRLEIVKKVFGVAVLIAASRFGPFGIAWGLFGLALIALLINTSQTGRLVGYGIWRQLRDVAPAIVVAGAMAIPVQFISGFDSFSEAVRLLAGVGLGLVLFGGMALVLRLPAVPMLDQLVFRRATRPTASDSGTGEL